MQTNYGLFLDRESLGPRVLTNPTVALGVALLDMDNLCLAVMDGNVCVKETYVPPLEHQQEDPECMQNFWLKNDQNQRQLHEWEQYKGLDPSIRTLYVKEFVQYCERICHQKKVELFVDTPLFDVVGIDALLDNTDPWEDKPPSWNFLLKNNEGKRVYNRIICTSSYLEGAMFLHPANSTLVRQAPGGIRRVVRKMYGIPDPPPFPYQLDHHCSHDAARRGWEFAWIRAHLKNLSPKNIYQ